MVRALLLMCIAGALALPGAAAATLEGKGIAIEVSETAPVGIVSVRSAPAGPSLFVQSDAVEPTWTLILMPPGEPNLSAPQAIAEGTGISIDPVSSLVNGKVETTAERLKITWDAVGVPSGTVRVSCSFEPDPEQPLIYGRITVDNQSRCRLLEVQFPRLTLRPTPAPAESITLAFPRAYGRSWRNPFDAPYGYLVGTREPAGLRTEMQFGTIYDDAGNGLYWAAYDGEGRHKRFVYDNAPGDGIINLKIGQIPENCHEPGQDYESPYPIVLGAYQGDWWDAAHLYRTWALEQKWCSRGPLETREDVPQWVKEAEVWIRGDSSRTDMELSREFYWHIQDFFGGTVGVQWYSWIEPRNWADPLRWPPMQGFAELCAEAGARGIMAMPYVNSLQWDTGAATWPQGAEKWALIGPDGQPVTGEASGASASLCMCAAPPEIQLWRETLIQACVRLVREAHVKGIYLDQLGGQCSRPCWATNHGHPVGGGSYAADGLRETCQACRTACRTVDPEAAISGERQPEFLMDVTDLRLEHYNVWPGWINMRAAVYGDMTANFGRTITWGGDEGDIQFFGRCGNTFVSGIKFGRIWPTGNRSRWLDHPEAKRFADYFKLVVDLRRAARKFLEFGWLQRRVELLSEVPQLTMIDQKKREMRIAAVLDSAWASHDGELAFVFTNISEQPQTVKWRAELSRYEIAEAETYQVAEIRRDGSIEELGSIEGAILERTEQMPAHSAVVYRVAGAEAGG